MKSSAGGLAGEVPPPVVTVTLPVPALAAAVTAVIWVAELTVKLVGAVPAIETAEAPVRLVPVMVTVVPPVVGPDEGLTPVTDGGAT